MTSPEAFERQFDLVAYEPIDRDLVWEERIRAASTSPGIQAAAKLVLAGLDTGSPLLRETLKQACEDNNLSVLDRDWALRYSVDSTEGATNGQ
jgi:hypothetical protein